MLNSDLQEIADSLNLTEEEFLNPSGERYIEEAPKKKGRKKAEEESAE